MATFRQIAPCLWFDTEAEDAARFYVSAFEGSNLENITDYAKEGVEIPIVRRSSA